VDISPCNRLDRLTSGVMFFGLNKTIANEFLGLFQQRNVQKEYYCRVVGKFPDGEVTVDKNIATISPKHGLNRLKDDGKPSSTMFEKVFYDEKRDQSVVLAKPLTGRTHQIRYVSYLLLLMAVFIFNTWAIRLRMTRFMRIPISSYHPMNSTQYPTRN
jgi:23S rRNA-/tRNA-specific pseudouridylate synthase